MSRPRPEQRRCKPSVEVLEARTLLATVRAVANSFVTNCREADNVKVAFMRQGNEPVPSFHVVAYPAGVDPATTVDDGAQFSGCPSCTSGPGGTSSVSKLYDDGVRIVEVVREPGFWRPGMTVRVGQRTAAAVTYLRVYERVAPGSYVQHTVVYADGNWRLKPLPPATVRDTKFNTSAVIGPIRTAVVCGEERPYADTTLAVYDPLARILTTTYRDGGSAVTRITPTRQATTASVQVRYNTVRSVLWVTSMNALRDVTSDVTLVTWTEPDGTVRQRHAGGFVSARGTDFLFRRNVASNHNATGSDIAVLFGPQVNLQGSRVLEVEEFPSTGELRDRDNASGLRRNHKTRWQQPGETTDLTFRLDVAGFYMVDARYSRDSSGPAPTISVEADGRPVGQFAARSTQFGGPSGSAWNRFTTSQLVGPILLQAGQRSLRLRVSGSDPAGAELDTVSLVKVSRQVNRPADTARHEVALPHRAGVSRELAAALLTDHRETTLIPSRQAAGRRVDESIRMPEGNPSETTPFRMGETARRGPTRRTALVDQVFAGWDEAWID